MSLGHIAGVGSELIVRPLCETTLHNTAVCSALALIIHEAVVEPIVDGLIYASISSPYQEEFDLYAFAVKAASSYGASKLSEITYGESLVASTVAGIAGGYFAGELWDSMYPSNHTHEEI